MSVNRKLIRICIFTCWFILPAGLVGQQDLSGTPRYYPERGQWERRDPAFFGLNQDSIEAAIRFHQEHESTSPRDQELGQSITFGKEPFGEGIGAFSTRGEASGLIIHQGYLVATWGDIQAVEMTHSVSKSFLSAVTGLAVEEGMIKSIHDPVATYLPAIELFQQVEGASPTTAMRLYPLYHPFETPHNRMITWNHLLRQTSDWEGTLWGKPDWADRPASDLVEEQARDRHPAGTVWEYNDVRVNALALASTMVWRKPLPQVLLETIMDPIGASHTWQWRGYRNSWIILDGSLVNVVSGGGHWGGGMFISAEDMARFGLLMMRNGQWNGQQLIPDWFIEEARTPTAAKPTYGFMNWFLNPDSNFLPSASESAVAFLGNGTNMIFFDTERELVIVARWIDNQSLDEFIRLILSAWD